MKCKQARVQKHNVQKLECQNKNFPKLIGIPVFEQTEDTSSYDLSSFCFENEQKYRAGVLVTVTTVLGHGPWSYKYGWCRVEYL